MSEFSLLSLNTFGIPFYLSWGRLGRLAWQLNRLPVTVLCLQELQQNAYMPLVQRNLTSYPHQIFEQYRYAPKGGLAVFSRVQFIDHRFEVYQDRGTWSSISFADWALFKGVLSANLELDSEQIVILNTHMNANYTGDWNRENLLARIQSRQVQQLVQVIHSYSEDVLVIVCGDLNFPRNSFLYEDLISRGRLMDPLADDQRSTYRPFPLVPSKWKIPLDYVLIRQPMCKKVQVDVDVIEIKDYSKQNPFQRFLTDHNALVLKICWDISSSKI